MPTSDVVEDRIRRQLGGVNDFPVELAEAVRSIMREAVALESQGSPFQAMPDSGDFRADFLSFNARTARLQRNLITIGTIPMLRQLRSEAPDEYAYMLQVIIDIIKYNIKNAQSKPAVLRAVERTMKRLLAEV